MKSHTSKYAAEVSKLLSEQQQEPARLAAEAKRTLARSRRRVVWSGPASRASGFQTARRGCGRTGLLLLGQRLQPQAEAERFHSPDRRPHSHPELSDAHGGLGLRISLPAGPSHALGLVPGCECRVDGILDGRGIR